MAGKDDIRIGTKNGCLTVIGDLNTYHQDEALERIQHFEQEKQEFLDGKWNRNHNGNVSSIDYFDYWIKTEERRAKELLYKCQCNCGKIHYVSPKLFLSKRHRYCDIISPEQASWNSARLRQSSYLSDEHKKWMIENGCGLRGLEREKKISKAQRIPDQFYDQELKLKVHDTLEVVGRSKDRETIIERQNKISIRLSKTYSCKCHLCGCEFLFTYADFDIRNDEYGSMAYEGYYSKAKCACHPISSFQWRTIKIFNDNHIDYRAEVCFDDLIGVGGINLLRYDFGVYESGELIALVECQGQQHFIPSEEFGISKFPAQQKNDELKRKYASDNGIKLIEIPYTLDTITKESDFLLDALRL